MASDTGSEVCCGYLYELLEPFISGTHRLMLLILRCLAKVLGEKLPATLELFHDPSQPTTSTLSMFRYPSQTDEEAAKGVGHNKHTDIRTLTFLLCQQWGLQVLLPQQNK